MANVPETNEPIYKRHTSPAQVIALLIYPVVFLVGVGVGLVIGLKQGKLISNSNTNTNRGTIVNTSIIPNANFRAQPVAENTNTVADQNRNTTVNTEVNTNQALLNGAYLQLDAATQATLQTQEQADLNQLVDQSLTMADIIRQQDLIHLKYNLLTYYAVKKEYPSSGGQLIRLERGEDDVFYTAMKQFYGGSFYEKIDPQSPKYYYGYSSDGQTFQLTCFLVSQNKPFRLTDSGQ